MSQPSSFIMPMMTVIMPMMTVMMPMMTVMTTKASEEASWQAAAGESGRTNNVCQAASSRHQMVPNMILGSRVIITVIVVPIIVISSVNVIPIIVTNIIIISNHHCHYLHQWLILVTTFTTVTNSQGIKPYWPKFCDSWSLVFPKKENAYYFHLECLVAPCCARVPFHKIAARLIHGGPTA